MENECFKGGKNDYINFFPYLGMGVLIKVIFDIARECIAQKANYIKVKGKNQVKSNKYRKNCNTKKA